MSYNPSAGGGSITNGDKGDITVSGGGSTWTLDTVNANVGTFGSATAVPIVTVNAKGLVTAASTAAVSGGGSSPSTFATGSPGTIAIKGTTAGAPGTGAFTPNAASSGFRAWSNAAVGCYFVRFEDGSDWEHGFCYWDGTSLSRASTQMFESSTGSALSLTASATAALISNIDQFLESAFPGPTRGAVPLLGQAGFTDIGSPNWTNITSPAGVAVTSTNYMTEQPRGQFTSATTANAATGRSPVYPSMLVHSTAGRGGGLMSYKFGFSQLPSNPRLVIGGQTGTLLSGATEPSAEISHFVFCGADSTDTNLQFITNNNVGAGTKTDTGIAWVINAWYHYAMWAYPGSLEWHQILVREDTGTIYYRKTSTDVPASGTTLKPYVRAMLTAVTGTAIILELGDIKLKAGR